MCVTLSHNPLPRQFYANDNDELPYLLRIDSILNAQGLNNMDNDHIGAQW